MATGGVSSVYLHVIDDVLSKVRDEFVGSGAGEAVLQELQARWEMKLMQCGALPPDVTRPPPPPKPVGATPVHDLNVPYEGPLEEYETPTAEMLFPPTPLQTPIQTPLPGIAEHGLYQTPTPGEYAPVGDPRDLADLKGGRPSPYMQPPSPWMSQRPLGVDVNVAYVEGREEGDRGASHQSLTQDFLMASSGKRKRDTFNSPYPSEGYIPQQDGSGDTTIEFTLPESINLCMSTTHGKERSVAQMPSSCQSRTEIPQLDGSHDDYNNSFHLQGGITEDYNTPIEHELRAATPSVSTPKPGKAEVVEDEEPPLNEDDDDDEDLDDLDHEEEEPHTQHLVLAQFDKVSRTKSRWKCTLKDGIMHLNNRDVLFNKANGEFDF